MSFATHFERYDDRFRPIERIDGYKETFTRTPDRRFARPLTLSEVTGPRNLALKLPVGTEDLSRLRPGAPRAVGQLMMLSGRLLDEDDRPIRGSVVELWQANAAGRYLHEADARNPAPTDANFLGSGRTLTDDEGRYRFITIKPGAYPVPGHPARWWRPPHIHLSVFGEGFLSRLVTQVFFPGEPLNTIDLLLNSVPDARGRERLVAQMLPMQEMASEGIIGYTHDVVVRGRGETPRV